MVVGIAARDCAHCRSGSTRRFVSYLDRSSCPLAIHVPRSPRSNALITVKQVGRMPPGSRHAALKPWILAQAIRLRSGLPASQEDRCTEASGGWDPCRDEVRACHPRARPDDAPDSLVRARVDRLAGDSRYRGSGGFRPAVAAGRLDHRAVLVVLRSVRCERDHLDRALFPVALP